MVERTSTRSTPTSSNSSTSRSSSRVLRANNTSSVPGLRISCATIRPSTRSRSDSTTSPPSTIGCMVTPRSVLQSTTVVTRSWATSTRRRVRYPEFAVFRAVSARPLRAPWVEMKYCSTSSPSRKLALIGVSIMDPSGLAIRPRIPANCLICAAEPRAPESAMMKMEFMESSSTVFPALSLTTLLPMPRIIARATCSLVRDQMSTTLL